MLGASLASQPHPVEPPVYKLAAEKVRRLPKATLLGSGASVRTQSLCCRKTVCFLL